MSTRTRVITGTAIAAGVAGAAVAAGRIFLARERRRDDPAADTSFQPLFDREHSIATFDDGLLHVIDRGSGPPVVLCHGVTLSVRTWTYQMRDLPTRGLRAIAFDSRGHGRSTAGTAGHAIVHLARDLKAVIETLDLRDAVLVGHSMGGVAVQAFAIEYPDVLRERVKGIVLLSTLARAPFGRAKRVRDFAERHGAHGDNWFEWMLGRRDIGYLTARLGLGRQALPSHVEVTRQMLLECSPETRLGAPVALVGFDLTDRLGAVDIPTLVIGGSADLLTPPAESKRIARHIGPARIEWVPGGGHMLMLEHADRITDLIARFCADVTATKRAAV
jgi:pimeloyl-ACP methyl ester carboxylesterase